MAQRQRCDAPGCAERFLPYFAAGGVQRYCSKRCQRRAIVQRRIARGLCVSCPQPRAEGRTLCAAHLADLRRRAAAYRAARRAA